MTSSEPLVDLILGTIRDAEPGSYMRLDAAARFDLEHARRLDAAERLAEFDQVQTLAETLSHPEATREPIRHSDLRM
jgi:hypothetical protein